MPTEDIWSPGPPPRRHGRRGRGDHSERDARGHRPDAPGHGGPVPGAGRGGAPYDQPPPQGRPHAARHGSPYPGNGQAYAGNGQPYPGNGHNGQPYPGTGQPHPGTGQPYPGNGQPHPGRPPAAGRPQPYGAFEQPRGTGTHPTVPPPMAPPPPLGRPPMGPPPPGHPGMGPMMGPPGMAPQMPPQMPMAPPMAPGRPGARPAGPFESGPFESGPFESGGAFGNSPPFGQPYVTAGPFDETGVMSPVSPEANLDPVENFSPLEVEPGEAVSVDSHPLRSFRKIRSHAKARRVPRLAVIMLILGLVVVGAGLRFVPGSPFGGDSGSGPVDGAAPMPFHSADITAETLGTSGFVSWAYLDRRDGSIVGSGNMSATTDSASMVKAWIAADYLRRSAEHGTTPPGTDLADLEAMIRDSDNAAADRVITLLGGTPESIGRMITMCQLSDARPGESWARTAISARDTVRMGGCLADGRAAGAQWTPWIIDAMRNVRGEGDFGIRKVFPAAQQPTIAIKNGWAAKGSDGTLPVNCLAIGENWVLAVLQRYPASPDQGSDINRADGVCQNVTRTLIAPR